MTAPEDRLTIRSFRECFHVERRMYKVDRWRLPVPWGVPLRGIGYAVVALVVVLILARVPVLGALLGVLPPALRLGLLPSVIAYLLCVIERDGRPAHRTLVALVRMRVQPRRVAAGRRVPAVGSRVGLGPVTFAADEHTSTYRAARIKGPSTVLLRYPARVRRSWLRPRRLTITQTSSTPVARGTTVTISERHELWVR